jgi:hypothetical protein
MIALADAPREIRQRFGVFVSYRKLYMAILDARIHGERIRGRWQVDETKLAEIVEEMTGTRIVEKAAS